MAQKKPDADILGYAQQRGDHYEYSGRSQEDPEDKKQRHETEKREHEVDLFIRKYGSITFLGIVVAIVLALIAALFNTTSERIQTAVVSSLVGIISAGGGWFAGRKSK